MRTKFYITQTSSISALRGLWIALSVVAMQLASVTGMAQNCPTTGTHTQNSSENTFYSGLNATLNAGSTSISLGAVPSATYGSAGIAIGDFVLIIQMQGSTINIPTPDVTSALYGANSDGLNAGFLTTGLQAGNMEFAVATNAVATTGGTLNIQSGLTYSYKNAAATSTAGRYTYQVIRVPTFYNITLSGTITTPAWNGSVGGVTVINAVNTLNFGSATINASSAGFRGGGGRGLSGQSGQNKFSNYIVSTVNANGSKGEGISGTPKYINFNNTLITAAVEGIPSGSYGRGGPGNAGGGANDSHPDGNDQNAGGGGGGNGGGGGTGGNGWYSFGATGGFGGTAFQTYYDDPNDFNTYITIQYNASHLIMGGGGGAGSTNNNSGLYGGLSSSGAPGGGMVIVNSLTITGTGTINVSGGAGNSTVLQDGSGGGGAGGSILIYANSGLSGITANARGGQGGDNHPAGVSATQHGPGGGGGGGVILSPAPLNAASSTSAGVAGISYGTNATSTYGAVPGTDGAKSSSVTASQLPPNMRTCQGTILPVSLMNFTATYVASNNVKISWSTTNEINSAYFLVERSVNAVDFGAIDQVTAGTSFETIHNYNSADQLAGVTTNTVYYRLKIVDQDGKFSYSKTIPVRLDQPAASLLLYPNPALSYTVLSIHSDRAGNGTLRVIDNSGRTVENKSFVANTGNNSILIDQLGNLPRGIYIVQVVLNNTLYNQKLVKQ